MHGLGYPADGYADITGGPGVPDPNYWRELARQAAASGQAWADQLAAAEPLERVRSAVQNQLTAARRSMRCICAAFSVRPVSEHADRSTSCWRRLDRFLVPDVSGDHPLASRKTDVCVQFRSDPGDAYPAPPWFSVDPAVRRVRHGPAHCRGYINHPVSTARTRRVRAAAVIAAAAGVSRVWLGLHRPTEVLGGWALGTLLLTGPDP